jgi:uncharacterized protein
MCPVKIVVGGASGLIGTPLVRALRADGHEVLRLVRREPAAPDEVPWDPAAGSLEPSALAGVEAAINLAGINAWDAIRWKHGFRWTESFKAKFRASRIDSTRTLSEALTKLDPIPRVLLNASAIGYYGDRGDQPLDESDAPGDDFMAETCVLWEDATTAARDAGVRVCLLRSGLVFDRRGGALAICRPIFTFGLGGRLGSGRQYWSVVSLLDEVRAIRFLLTADDVAGPINITAPDPATNAEVTKAFGRIVHRPTVLWVPGPALQLVFADFSSEMLGSHRVLPRQLEKAGFTFEHPDVDSVLRAGLAG